VKLNRKECKESAKGAKVLSLVCGLFVLGSEVCRNKRQFCKNKTQVYVDCGLPTVDCGLVGKNSGVRRHKTEFKI
jgi:hypothetical protein